MRLFFALEIDDDTRHRLEQIAERLRAWDLEGRWVHPSDYHVTLLYLGETADHETGWIEHAADELCAHLAAPTLFLPGLGAFAGKHQPRIVYAAVEDRDEWCAAVHRDLCEVVSEGVVPHYQPHITLLRPDQRWTDGRWPALFEAFGQALWGRCGVDALTLFESAAPRQLGGQRYRAVRRWPLAQG